MNPLDYLEQEIDREREAIRHGVADPLAKAIALIMIHFFDARLALARLMQ